MERKPQYRTRVAGVRRTPVSAMVSFALLDELRVRAEQDNKLLSAYVADLLAEHVGVPA